MISPTQSLPARVAAGVTATMMMIILALGWGGSIVHAQPNDITWSVGPADSTGPDGRRWVDTTVDPGQTYTDHFAVTNKSAIEVTFALTAADGYITDTGRFNMLPATQASTDSGSWITIAPTVTVAAGETAVVPFTLTAPGNATPGDHAAGIAASVANVGNAANGSAITVQSRVGFRVMTRVSGPLNPSLNIEDLTATYSGSWNPFSPGAVDVTFRVQNDGNISAVIDGAVTSANSDAAVQSNQGTLFPGDEAEAVSHVQNVWPFGLVTGEVTIRAKTADEDNLAATEFPATVEKYTAWAMPWPQMGVLGTAALSVLAVSILRIRSRRKMAYLLAQARDAGYAEAGAVSSQSGMTKPTREAL